MVTGCFFLFDPGQIRHRASVRLSSYFFYLRTTIYTPPPNEIPGYAPARDGVVGVVVPTCRHDDALVKPRRTQLDRVLRPSAARRPRVESAALDDVVRVSSGLPRCRSGSCQLVESGPPSASWHVVSRGGRVQRRTTLAALTLSSLHFHHTTATVS